MFPLLFYGPLVGGAAGTGLSGSSVGATPQQLEEVEVRGEEVPNVDGKIEECLRLTAGAQIQCWAETDQLLMETVVPWVPYLFEGSARWSRIGSPGSRSRSRASLSRRRSIRSR